MSKASQITIEMTNEPIIGNAGLLAIGELLRISGMDDVCAHRESLSNAIPDKDVLRILSGLIAVGKTGFDHIKQFQDNDFFMKALSIARMPSEATLRQRFEQMSIDTQAHTNLASCTKRMLKRVGFTPRITKVKGFIGVRIDTDGTILDNSNTKKEGVEKAYNGISGYAPLCSFLEGGLVLGAELRPGSHHALHDGFLDYYEQVRQNIRSVHKRGSLLWVEDAAFDASELMVSRIKNKDFFIVRHNLHRKSPQIFIQIALQEGEMSSPRIGKRVYTGSTIQERAGVGRLRLVYEVTERTTKKGQVLLQPEYTLFSVWTNLAEVSDGDVLQLYRDRGTCEQYFAELKSELDLERLPSGKFEVNALYFQLGILISNMLRIMGESLIGTGIIGLKKATRRRLRTIIQGLMYLCGRMVHHARRCIVRVVSHGGFGEALMGLHRKFAAT